MNTSVTRLLISCIQQLAAEAFVVRTADRGQVPDSRVVKNRLEAGNGHVSRFLPTQAIDFVDRFEVLAQYRNDPLDASGTGFSGTLMKDRNTGELTLSFRSTEFIEDAVRDSKSTNELEIKELGWALGQISAMESWYRELREDPRYLAGRDFRVTGYSLGGHLATAFNLLRREEAAAGVAANPITDTITFNGAGVGGLKPGVTLGSVIAEFDRLRALPDIQASSDWAALSIAERTRYRNLALGRLMAIESEASRLQGIDAQFAFGVRPPAGEQGTLNYQLAAVLAARDTIPVSNAPFAFGGTNWIPTSPVFASDTIQTMFEVVGSDGGNLGPSFVANSGVHYGQRLPVYIEDQPLLRGLYSLGIRQGSVASNPQENDFADTHSLILLVDSLSLLALFERMDPSFTLERGREILAAASDSFALTQQPTQGRAEGDTLERTLDALASLLLGPGTVTTLPDYSVALQGNTWHLDALRIPFHARIGEVAARIDALASDGFTALRVESLVNLPANELAERASAAGNDGYAYRYALSALNPFALLGLGYAQHSTQGQLELAAVAPDGVTREWIDARAEMLDVVVRNNMANGSVGVALGPRYSDLGRGLTLGGNLPARRATVFGGAGDDSIEGEGADDRLFGGGGSDTLSGFRGRDHLEGGAGDDRLDGGPGDDRLEGGSGFDTYVYGFAGGRDAIFDVDGAGKVQFLGRDLGGGDEVAPGRYEDAAGTHYALLDDGRGAKSLLVDGMLEIEDFESGDLGIVLRPATAPEPLDYSGAAHTYADAQLPSGQSPVDPLSLRIDLNWAGSNGRDSVISNAGKEFFTRAGNDLIMIVGTGTVRIDGGADADRIDLSLAMPSGPSQLVGGAGSDVLIGSDWSDVIYGDNWRVQLPDALDISRIDSFQFNLKGPNTDPADIPADVLFFRQSGAYGDLATFLLTHADSLDSLPGLRDNYVSVIGTEGWNFPGGLQQVVAYLQGASPTFDDTIDGGDGDDTIYGGSGSDVVRGGPGDDMIEGDSPAGLLPNGAGAALGDTLGLFGRPGDDYLDGGDGNDSLVDTQGGDDTLVGGAGNDTLRSAEPAGDPTLAAFNLLDGGDGDDILGSGGSPNGFDVLLGGAGSDQLTAAADALLDGGIGDDTYTLLGSTAHIRDEGGIDAVRGAVFLSVADGPPFDINAVMFDTTGAAPASSVLVQREGADLVYRVAGSSGPGTPGPAPGGPPGPGLVAASGDVDIVFEDWFKGPNTRIEQVGTLSADRFEHWGSRQIGGTESATFEGGEDVDLIAGSSSGDVIRTGGGADLVSGRGGDDWLDGGEGDDTYFYAAGHGDDVIADAGGNDVLKFGPGIAASDLSMAYEGGSLVLRVAGGSVTLAGVTPQSLDADLPVERLSFADGSSIDVAAAAGALPLERGVEAANPPPIEPVDGGDAVLTPSAAESTPPAASIVVAPTDMSPRALESAVSSSTPGEFPQEAGAIQPSPRTDPPDLASRAPEPGADSAGPVIVEAAIGVGVPSDPVYREIDARLDRLLLAGRAGFAERYAEAINEFNRRYPQADPTPAPSSDDDLAWWNGRMHAWHAVNQTFDEGESGRADGTWLAGWGPPTGGTSSLDELIAAGARPSLSRSLSERLQGVHSAPGLTEGLIDIRAG